MSAKIKKYRYNRKKITDNRLPYYKFNTFDDI